MARRVIGIDPGTRVSGYGIVDIFDRKVVAVAAGIWNVQHLPTLGARLAALQIEFLRVCRAFEPQMVCVEQAFVAKNARSALYLGHARGVFLANAHLQGIIVTEMSATQAKQIVTSNGRANKELVASCLVRLLQIDLHQIPFDASDALGLAYARALQIQQSNISDPTSSPDLKFRGGTQPSEKMIALFARKRSQRLKGFEHLLKK